MPTNSINIANTGFTNFTASQPVQRISIINTINPAFLRYVVMSQDSVQVVFHSQSIVIPMTSVMSAAVSASPALSWAPVLSASNSSSQTITGPTSSYFVVTQSIPSESPVSYQWYYQSGSFNGGNWTNVTGSTNSSSYTGSSTPALTCSVTNKSFQSTCSYFCVATNLSGVSSSSIFSLIVS